MSALFFDTETTGMWNFKAQADDPAQPFPIQIAAILDDDEGNTRAEISLLLRWDSPSIQIEEGALRVHGISPNLCETYGVRAESGLAIFNNLVSMADVLVAHNINFDIKIVRRAYIALEKEQFFPEIESFCTMITSTPLVRIPSPRGSGYKWPTLDEAYRHFVDPGGFSGAHDAMVDVRACREVYYKLKEQGHA